VNRPRIVKAANDLLFAADGQRYIDLFSAHGATFLGHCHPGVVAEVAAQLERVWLTGGLDSEVLAQTRAGIDSFFPSSHGCVALYSTGMEAAEFALRIARVATGRAGAAGFENSMHGKSLATAFLGWDNQDAAQLPDFHRLPFVHRASEEQVLGELSRALLGRKVGAVFVEPLQGSAGGRMASDGFYREVARLCAEHGALLIFDEILTGFYRTGAAFRFEELGITPDVVLIGKAMGNGFPVSAVVADRRITVRPQMLPGSTFAGNPLAGAAVSATLTHLRALDVASRVAAIEQTVVRSLGWLRDTEVALRGKGALWVIELPASVDVEAVVVAIYSAGVCVGITGRQIRVIPAATIEPANLERGCAVTAEEIMKALKRTAARG
jgi:acetylornithine/succinyldiaminopimelate/putrescine aminotransferase